MKKKSKLSIRIQALAVTTPLVLVSSLSAFEKPTERMKQQFLKEKVAEAEVNKEPQEVKKLAMLGVGGNPVSETLSLHLDLAANAGLVVFHVVPGSSADQAGIQRHDIITGINDQPIASQEHLSVAIAAYKPGDEVTVKLIQKGKLIEKKVKLGESDKLVPAEKVPMRRADDLFRMLNGMDGHLGNDDMQRIQDEVREHFEKLREKLKMNDQLRLEPGMFEFQMNDHVGAMNMLGGASMTMADEKGSVTIKTLNNKKEVIIKNRAGEVIFEGPYDTEQDKAAVPDDLAKRIERLGINKHGDALQLKINPHLR